MFCRSATFSQFRLPYGCQDPNTTSLEISSVKESLAHFSDHGSMLLYHISGKLHAYLHALHTLPYRNEKIKLTLSRLASVKGAKSHDSSSAFSLPDKHIVHMQDETL